jgi:hypothetical protein
MSVCKLAQWPGKLVPGRVPPEQAVRWLGLAPGPQVQHNPWHLVASLAHALWFAVSPPKIAVQKWAQALFGVQGLLAKALSVPERKNHPPTVVATNTLTICRRDTGLAKVLASSSNR